MTFAICTLGCRVNQYESRAIAEKLTSLLYTENKFSQKCDYYIINTCAVTSESVRKSRQMIRRAKKNNPYAKVIVTGCFAQISPKEAQALNCAEYIIGNENKFHDVISAIENDKEANDIVWSNLSKAEYENYSLNKAPNKREYIKIEDGCEGKCAYCVIPRARGPIRSKPFNIVLNEVKTLAEKGTKEVILTGIEIASYQEGLDKLLCELDNIDGIERISCGSIEPTLLKAEFIETLSHLKKFTPHLHISLQSGSTGVLNRMRRKYNADFVLKTIEYIRSKIQNVTFTCDIIVGFPGETEAEFEETKEFLKKARFLHAHIFTYSKRPMTEAEKMPNQINEEIKIRRASVLSVLQEKIKKEILSEELRRQSVPILFETYKNNINCGHSDNYIEYEVVSSENLSGKLKNVIPVSVSNERIQGKLFK